MKQDKDLLLKDLCSRLPYKVKVNYNGSVCTIQSISSNGEVLLEDEGGVVFPDIEDSLFVNIEEVSPYLFPLSSMTEKQKKEFDHIIEIELKAFEVDFYNKYHLDWRGLIPMGLAIDCTNLNIH